MVFSRMHPEEQCQNCNLDLLELFCTDFYISRRLQNTLMSFLNTFSKHSIIRANGLPLTNYSNNLNIKSQSDCYFAIILKHHNVVNTLALQLEKIVLFYYQDNYKNSTTRNEDMPGSDVTSYTDFTDEDIGLTHDNPFSTYTTYEILDFERISAENSNVQINDFDLCLAAKSNMISSICRCSASQSRTTSTDGCVCSGMLFVWREDGWKLLYCILDHECLRCYQSCTGGLPVCGYNLLGCRIRLPNCRNDVEELNLHLTDGTNLLVRIYDKACVLRWINGFIQVSLNDDQSDSISIKASCAFNSFRRQARRTMNIITKKAEVFMGALLRSSITGTRLPRSSGRCVMHGYIKISTDGNYFGKKFCICDSQGNLRVFKNRRNIQNAEINLLLQYHFLTFPLDKKDYIQFNIIERCSKRVVLIMRGRDVYKMGRILNVLSRFMDILNSQYPDSLMKSEASNLESDTGKWPPDRKHSSAYSKMTIESSSRHNPDDISRRSLDMHKVVTNGSVEDYNNHSIYKQVKCSTFSCSNDSNTSCGSIDPSSYICNVQPIMRNHQQIERKADDLLAELKEALQRRHVKPETKSCLSTTS
ncbi:hypothetical protein GJ496_005035 [Pomphorhynchus laevis]|nr:hypothetical protein GJ496_005035 [Pomphorhynchus laevis]